MNNGMFHSKSELENKRIYTFNNMGEARRLIVEHPITLSAQLISPVKFADKTHDQYRFEINLQQGETTFEVVEKTTLENSLHDELEHWRSNMRYEIMNRQDATGATMEAEAPDTVIISITDCGDKKNKFNPAPWLKGVLDIQFDDVDFGGKNCITAQQADEIAEFVLNIKRSVKRVIIHCEYGQSRSAGVAAAISTYLEGHDNSIFINRNFFPNKTCYRYVLSALKKMGRSPKYFFKKLFLRKS